MLAALQSLDDRFAGVAPASGADATIGSSGGGSVFGRPSGLHLLTAVGPASPHQEGASVLHMAPVPGVFKRQQKAEFQQTAQQRQADGGKATHEEVAAQLSQQAVRSFCMALSLFL